MKLNKLSPSSDSTGGNQSSPHACSYSSGRSADPATVSSPSSRRRSESSTGTSARPSESGGDTTSKRSRHDETATSPYYERTLPLFRMAVGRKINSCLEAGPENAEPLMRREVQKTLKRVPLSWILLLVAVVTTVVSLLLLLYPGLITVGVGKSLASTTICR